MSVVYRGFTQSQLDAAYNNRAVERDLDAVKIDRDRRSLAMYATSKVSRDRAYGPGPRQRLDYFHAPAAGKPTVAYIHGGYWQLNDKEPNAFVVEGLLAQGLNVALLEYTLAPAAKMTQIVGEIRTAIGWLTARLKPEFGASTSLVVAGHSAGGHLTAMAAGLTGVTAALPISGLFDLEPIRLSYLNAPLRMDEAEAGANSPTNLPLPEVPVTVAVGAAELPELLRQSEDYFARLTAAGRTVRRLVAPGATHFSVLEQVARPDGSIAKEAARLAGA